MSAAQLLWAERMIDSDGATFRFRGGEPELTMLKRAAEAGSTVARVYLQTIETQRPAAGGKAPTYKVGDRIEVEWQGQWFKARILEQRGADSFKIHDDGYGNEWDEWVKPKRMRRLR